MNILFCYYRPINNRQGGISAVTYTLMQGLNKHGHKCYAVSILRDEEDSIENQYFLPNHTVDENNEENRIWYQNFLEDKQIEVVINQNALQSSIPEWAILWSKTKPVKILTVYHNALMPMFSCRKECIKDNKIVKKLGLLPLFDRIWQYMFRLKYREKFRRSILLSDKVVMLSPNYFSELAWFSGIDVNEKYVSVANPASERFNIDLADITKEKEVVFVGRLEQQKRLDYLLEIWRNVVKTHEDWHLSIVGEGSLESRLKSQVKNENIKNITFEGFKDPLEYYKRASIFCMTSEFEGFPGVLTEGMSCGCVPIVFNSYASASDIINSDFGILVKPYDLNEYIKSLTMLMEDKDRLIQMSVKAKERSKAFSLDSVIEQWEKFFI